jgi:hypothetical protein
VKSPYSDEIALVHDADFGKELATNQDTTSRCVRDLGRRLRVATVRIELAELLAAISEPGLEKSPGGPYYVRAIVIVHHRGCHRAVVLGVAAEQLTEEFGAKDDIVIQVKDELAAIRDSGYCAYVVAPSDSEIPAVFDYDIPTSLCICEYNAVFGDLHAVSVPHDPAFLCGQSHFSHLYFGASIAALRSLAAQKGYRFLGTTLAGNDAFFVREDYAPAIAGALKNIVACPSRARGSRDPAGHLSFVGGGNRFDLISHLPVVLTETGETVTLKSLGPVYSEDWL